MPTQLVFLSPKLAFMLDLPPWDPTVAEACWILILFMLGYSSYYFFAESPRWRNYFRMGSGGEGRHVIGSRYLGGLTIGVLPAVVLLLVRGTALSTYGLKAEFDLLSLGWILGLAAIITPMNYFNTQKAKHLAMYPTVRRPKWSKLQMLTYALSWVVYLFGYELMFRGLLLFGLLPVLGPWLTIVLNVVLYVLVHLPKSVEESVGALPLGLLLCLITLTTGTIWVAVVVHITLALSNFFFSLRHHPDMQIIGANE
jgi:membrane protease YdiL (CAAX protease family)